MKKVLLLFTIVIFTFNFSQNNTVIEIKGDKNKIERIYPKGFADFKERLAGNLQYTANAYQVLGDFTVKFSISEKGKVSDVYILPKVSDQSFEKAVTRDISRMKKWFSSNDKKEDVLLNLNFSRDYKSVDDRVNFTMDDRSR